MTSDLSCQYQYMQNHILIEHEHTTMNFESVTRFKECKFRPHGSLELV
jgi:hypothetical protein